MINAQHEVLNKYVVSSTRGWHDVRKVGKLLDQDDAVIAAGLEEGGDGIADEDSHQDWDAVRDLTSQLEHDHRDGDGVGDCSTECCCSDSCVSSRHDERDLITIPETKKPILEKWT